MPPIALDDRLLGFGEILVPAELLEHAVGELGIAVLDLGAERVGALGQEVVLARRAVGQLDLALDAEAGAERAAAVHDVQIGVVERVGAGMLELRRAPARPRQAVIVALGRTILRPQRDQVEVLLVGHVQLEALRRLAAIAGRPAAAIDLAQDVLGNRPIVLDLDVLEHLVGEAELLRQEIHDLVVVLRFEDRLDDLLAPLQRAVRRRARARRLELRADRQQIGVVLALAEHGPGGRMRIGDHQQVELLDALGGFRHAGDGVAAVAQHDHRLEVVLLGDLVLRQQRRVEPARRRNARASP